MGAWDARHAWAEDGALSASSWMAHRTTTSKRDAGRMVRAARLAFRRERTAKALDAGDVSASQVEVLATAVKGRERLFDRDEDVLLDAAATLGVDDFTIATKHWRAAADDEMSRIDALHTFDTRGVTLASTLFGRVELHASLDAEGGATVERALDAYDSPDPVDGVTPPRTLEQRRADALVQICSEALDRRHRQAGSRHLPNVDLVLDAERLGGDATFDPNGALRDRRHRAGGPCGRRADAVRQRGVPGGDEGRVGGARPGAAAAAAVPCAAPGDRAP